MFFYIVFFLISEIDELFKVFDKNGDKSITASELGAAMRFLNLNPTKKEIADTMKLLDVNSKFIDQVYVNPTNKMTYNNCNYISALTQQIR